MATPDKDPLAELIVAAGALIKGHPSTDSPEQRLLRTAVAGMIGYKPRLRMGAMETDSPKYELHDIVEIVIPDGFMDMKAGTYYDTIHEIDILISEFGIETRYFVDNLDGYCHPEHITRKMGRRDK